ncbi:MAG: histidine phosphatase family protein [Acidobacteriota bacterium]|nr:histidine phosphatase family protein [Acidobacteriota bacterium]
MSGSTTLVFLRHVQTAGEDENASMSEVGQRQLDQVTHVLRQYSISKIYSSDLWRAVQPAQSLAKSLGVPFQSSSALREIRSGLEIPVPPSDAHNREDIDAFEQRVAKALNDIVELNEHTTVVVVAHSGTIRAALRYLLDLPLPSLDLPSVSQGGLIILKRGDSGKWKARS